MPLTEVAGGITTITNVSPPPQPYGARQLNVPTEVGYGILTAATIGVSNMNNSIVWPQWNITYATNTYTNYSHWPFNTDWPFNTGTTTTIQQFTWSAWSDKHSDQVQRYSRRKPSEKELLAALEQEKRLREAAEKAALEARMVEKRSNDLLRMCLSPQQIEDYEKRKCFYVEIAGPGGKKERYRIDHGSHGNVKQVDSKGSIIRSFCIQPSGVPVADVLLTQKLWLEASEETREKFWETANISELMHEKQIPHNIPRHERRKYAEVHGLLH